MTDQTPMQALRHEIREGITDYYSDHRTDYNAYMTMHAVLFTLTGIPDMSRDEQIMRLTTAHEVVFGLLVLHPYSKRLRALHAKCDQMLDLARTKLSEEQPKRKGKKAKSVPVSEVEKLFTTDEQQEMAKVFAALLSGQEMTLGDQGQAESSEDAPKED